MPELDGGAFANRFTTHAEQDDGEDKCKREGPDEWREAEAGQRHADCLSTDRASSVKTVHFRHPKRDGNGLPSYFTTVNRVAMPSSKWLL